MFSQQYTRQLSTSPPPFQYGGSIPATEGVSYAAYPQTAAYCAMPPNGMDMPLYPQYLPPIQQGYVSNLAPPPIKQEYYGDDDMSPFSMSYASMSSGIDVSAAQTYDPVYVSSKPHLQHRNYSYPSTIG
jgi:hypothetical protein